MLVKRTKSLVKNILLNTVAPSSLFSPKIRVYIYKTLGIKINKSYIFHGCFFGGNNVKIGENSFINCRCFFDNTEAIEIGENCQMGMEVMFITSTHEIGKPERRAGSAIGKPIKVGNGCWVCARATILPGVTIGDGCIIAAGSVVTKDCLPNGLYAGVPAKRMKELSLTTDYMQIV